MAAHDRSVSPTMLRRAISASALGNAANAVTVVRLLATPVLLVLVLVLGASWVTVAVWTVLLASAVRAVRPAPPDGDAVRARALVARHGEGPLSFMTTWTGNRYWFTSERGRFETIGYPVDERVLARLRQVLTVVADGIAAGAFPARPGEVDRQSYKNCKYCDFDRLCQRDRARQWERKRDAAVLSSYVELAEGTEP